MKTDGLCRGGVVTLVGQEGEDGGSADKAAVCPV